MQKKPNETTIRGKKTKKEKRPARLFYLIPFMLVCFVLFLGASEKAIPDEIYTDYASGKLAPDAELSSKTADGVTDGGTAPENEYTAKLFGFIPAKTVEGKLPADLKLTPCGDVFGVKFFTKGVVITDLSEVESDEGIICPASKAGLKTGDVITSVNGKEINTVEKMTEYISSGSGKALSLEFVRDGKSYKATLKPVSASSGGYKAGMWVRDSTAGIGTITFYKPEDGSFAGLGHGIYDADTELLLPLLRGAIVNITLDDIIKGRDGHPGELKGSFSSEKTGSLYGNTACGVYGVLERAPETVYDPLPCAMKSEVETGKATILSNVDGRGVKEYGIEIVKIYSGTEETKNFVIQVTDDSLLAKTGGIVRGMSGSPIIQNGKLVGAVTHVLVNNPNRGYGIFIENMLDKMPESLPQE